MFLVIWVLVVGLFLFCWFYDVARFLVLCWLFDLLVCCCVWLLRCGGCFMVLARGCGVFVVLFGGLNVG